jgi:fumarate reductase subunit D
MKLSEAFIVSIRECLRTSLFLEVCSGRMNQLLGMLLSDVIEEAIHSPELFTIAQRTLRLVWNDFYSCDAEMGHVRSHADVVSRLGMLEHGETNVLLVLLIDRHSAIETAVSTAKTAGKDSHACVCCVDTLRFGVGCICVATAIDVFLYVGVLLVEAPIIANASASRTASILAVLGLKKLLLIVVLALKLFTNLARFSHLDGISHGCQHAKFMVT